jgi:hypothetical protein
LTMRERLKRRNTNSAKSHQVSIRLSALLARLRLALLHSSLLSLLALLARRPISLLSLLALLARRPMSLLSRRPLLYCLFVVFLSPFLLLAPRFSVSDSSSVSHLSSPISHLPFPVSRLSSPI